MSEAEVSASDIYLKDNIVFAKGKNYLISAGSGHGKTSILNFIYGSNKCFDGEIHYDTDYYSVFDLRKTKISYVFQDLKLFPSLSVFENIQIKNILTNNKSVGEIENLLKKVSLLNKKNSIVQELSLGQKQRVAVIRALCQPFDFLLLDEPFSHLDPENIELLSDVIDTELSKNSAGLILTSLGNKYSFDYDLILNI